MVKVPDHNRHPTAQDLTLVTGSQHRVTNQGTHAFMHPPCLPQSDLLLSRPPHDVVVVWANQSCALAVVEFVVRLVSSPSPPSRFCSCSSSSSFAPVCLLGSNTRSTRTARNTSTRSTTKARSTCGRQDNCFFANQAGERTKIATARELSGVRLLFARLAFFARLDATCPNHENATSQEKNKLEK